MNHQFPDEVPATSFAKHRRLYLATTAAIVGWFGLGAVSLLFDETPLLWILGAEIFLFIGFPVATVIRLIAYLYFLLALVSVAQRKVDPPSLFKASCLALLTIVVGEALMAAHIYYSTMTEDCQAGLLLFDFCASDDEKAGYVALLLLWLGKNSLIIASWWSSLRAAKEVPANNHLDGASQ